MGAGGGPRDYTLPPGSTSNKTFNFSEWSVGVPTGSNYPKDTNTTSWNQPYASDPLGSTFFNAFPNSSSSDWSKADASGGGPGASAGAPAIFGSPFSDPANFLMYHGNTPVYGGKAPSRPVNYYPELVGFDFTPDGGSQGTPPHSPGSGTPGGWSNQSTTFSETIDQVGADQYGKTGKTGQTDLMQGQVANANYGIWTDVQEDDNSGRYIFKRARDPAGQLWAEPYYAWQGNINNPDSNVPVPLSQWDSTYGQGNAPQDGGDPSTASGGPDQGSPVSSSSPTAATGGDPGQPGVTNVPGDLGSLPPSSIPVDTGSDTFSGLGDNAPPGQFGSLEPGTNSGPQLPFDQGADQNTQGQPQFQSQLPSWDLGPGESPPAPSSSGLAPPTFALGPGEGPATISPSGWIGSPGDPGVTGPSTPDPTWIPDSQSLYSNDAAMANNTGWIPEPDGSWQFVPPHGGR